MQGDRIRGVRRRRYTDDRMPPELLGQVQGNEDRGGYSIRDGRAIEHAKRVRDHHRFHDLVRGDLGLILRERVHRPVKVVLHRDLRLLPA